MPYNFSTKMRKLLTIIFLSFFAVFSLISQTKNEIKNDSIPKGISVSPSSLRFSIKTGKSESKQIVVRNDTEFERAFQVLLKDYGVNDINRKSINSVVPDDYKYGLSKWTLITPNNFVLKPFESQKINVLIDIPSGEDNAHALWNMIVIEEVKERQKLDVPNNASAIGLGIVPTVGFGVYVYQNPPNLPIAEVSLISLKKLEEEKKIVFRVKNEGQAIGFSNYYMDILNVATGQKIKIPAKQITVLPTAVRELTINLEDLPNGSYNALLVIDYGGKDFLETTEFDFILK